MVKALKINDRQAIRLKALKDATKVICLLCAERGRPVTDRDSPAHLVHLSVGYPPRDCLAAPIYRMIAIEGL